MRTDFTRYDPMAPAKTVKPLQQFGKKTSKPANSNRNKREEGEPTVTVKPISFSISV